MLPRKCASCGRRGAIAAPDVGAPDHLVGRRLDLLALEEVLALLVAGEVDHAVAVLAHRLGDREQHRVAEAAAEQQHVLVRRESRSARRSVPSRRPARPCCRYATSRLEHAELERDQRQQAAAPCRPTRRSARCPSISSGVAADAPRAPTRSSAAGRTARAGSAARRPAPSRPPRRSSASAGRRPRRARSARRRAARPARATRRRARAARAGSSDASSRANSATTCG